MLRWLVLIPLALCALPAPAARASCAAAVGVQGRLLLGVGSYDRDALPPKGDEIDAISPACNDGGQELTSDGDTRVRTLDGIPARIAVLGSDGDLYVAPGSLVAIATHPVHAALPRPVRTPHPCPRVRSHRVRVKTAFDNGFEVRGLGGRANLLRVLDRTRITNRPVVTPLVAGQRLRVLVRDCGRTAVAERITFVGRDVVPERYVRYRAPGGAGGGPPALAWVGGAIVVVLVLGFGWLVWFAWVSGVGR